MQNDKEQQQRQNSNPPTTYDPATFSTDLQAVLVRNMVAEGSLYLRGSMPLDPEQRQALALEVLAIREDTRDPEVAATLLASWLQGRSVSTTYGFREQRHDRLQRLIVALWAVLDR